MSKLSKIKKIIILVIISIILVACLGAVFVYFYEKSITNNKDIDYHWNSGYKENEQNQLMAEYEIFSEKYPCTYVVLYLCHSCTLCYLWACTGCEEWE